MNKKRDQKPKNWEEELAKFMRHPNYRPMRRNELGRAVRAYGDALIHYRHTLKKLVQDGKIKRVKNNRFAWAKEGEDNEVLLEGTVSMHPKGFGFFTPQQATAEGDLFIPSKYIKDARHKDRVKVRVLPEQNLRVKHGRKRKKVKDPALSREVEVVEVLRRGIRETAGLLFRKQRSWFAIPDESKLGKEIYITGFADGASKPRGKEMKARIVLDEFGDSLRGEVVEILGPAGDTTTEMRSLLAVYQLPENFPDAVIKEASQKHLDIDTALQDPIRKDLRTMTTITIDPETARDFDDAVSLEKLKNGNWSLAVHIADVSHYVPKGSEIDRDAEERATSVYLIDRVITMLPENLTTVLCSLVPHEDRLAHSVVMEVNPNGELVTFESFPSVINSDARFTYEQVQEVIDGAPLPEGFDQDLRPLLIELHAFSQHVRGCRKREGAMEFSVPDRNFTLDQEGNIDSIAPAESYQAYQLIEECMLLANKAVATCLTEKSLDGIFRVHEEPNEEQWNKMGEELGALGITVTPQKREDLNQLAKGIQNPHLRYAVILTILKNMKRAEYKHEPAPHFGLAFDLYTHFTSPIRRYADLMAHRMLYAMYRNEPPPYSATQIEIMARHCSDQDRNAEEAERTSKKLKLIAYYAQKIDSGDIGPYEAYVVGFIQQGILVELDESLQRGLVSFESLREKDVFKLDKSGLQAMGKFSRERIGIGDRVKVLLNKADRTTLELDCRMEGS